MKSISIFYFLSYISMFLCDESNIVPERERDLEYFDATQNKSVYTDVTSTTALPSPNSPRKISASQLDRGMIDLSWEPPVNNEWLTEFEIYCKLLSTRLTKALQPDDRDNSIHFQFIYSRKSYRTQLILLPSTHYRIDIKSVVKCARYNLTSNASSIEIKTPSSFSWVEYEPSFTVNDTIHSIIIKLPRIAYATLNSAVHVIIIGPALCTEAPSVDKMLAEDIGLKDDEKAWHVGTFMTPPSLISIGDHGNASDATNCALFECNTYRIVVVIRDESIEDVNLSTPLVWRSGSIFMDPIPTRYYKVWAFTVLLLFVIGIVGCLHRPMGRNQRGDTENDVDVFEPVVELGRERPTSMNYRESFLLVPPVLRHTSYLTSINEETSEESSQTIRVKREEFSDYVELKKNKWTSSRI